MASSTNGTAAAASTSTSAAATNTPPDPETYATKLTSTSADLKSKFVALTEIKDLTETYFNSGYPAFLQHILPACTTLLGQVAIAFLSDSIEHRLRHLLLDMLQRLPPSEAARPFAADLMNSMLTVLEKDNEENGVLALKIVIDLHRNHKLVLEPSVEPFLKIVQGYYTGLRETITSTFGTTADGAAGSGLAGESPMGAPSPAAESQAASTAGSEGPLGGGTSTGSGTALPRTLPASTASFKVLAECPIAIVLIFQSYRGVVATAIKVFVPLIIQDCLLLEAAPQAEAHSAAATRGDLFVGVAPSIGNRPHLRAVYTDMVIAQVKSLSFIAYVMRGTASVMREHAATLPTVSVRLLKDCPPEASGPRKELLVATRHILSTDFRVFFVDQLDALLDPRVNVLVGTGVTAQETQRPLAISMLADLVHHVRDKLTPAQLGRVVSMHAQTLHDDSLAPSIQTMCVKLLLNLVDTICTKFGPPPPANVADARTQPTALTYPSKDPAADLLRAMVDTFVEKLSSLSRLRRDVETARKQIQAEKLNAREKEREKLRESEGESDDAEQPATASVEEVDGGADKDDKAEDSSPDKTASNAEDALSTTFEMNDIAIERARPIQAPAVLLDFAGDPFKDARFLFRNILFGFKTLIPQLRLRGSPLRDSELIGRLFVNGIKCWSLHDGRDGREEKEILDLFTNILIELPHQTFHEVLTAHFPFLFQSVLSSPALLTIPQNLLANDGTSRRFVAILLRFLIAPEHLNKLGNSDMSHASASLRLFKMAFMAVTIFPEDNEAVLQPHLSHLIMTSMRLAAAAEEPTNYFLLLRSLFRSIGGGRFELLYKDVLPLLPVLLENLNALLAAAESSTSHPDSPSSTAARRELFVDLCLTVPVRLSVLLPYLGYLMRPLVLALQSKSSPDLVSQGLRTLELCIDNLTQEFLDPIMAPFSRDIMAALWTHLQPLPHNHQHSHTTMRILGKMGGRNRRSLQLPPKLEWKQTGPALREQVLTVTLEGKSQTLELGTLIDLSLTNIRLSSKHYRRHAFEILKHISAVLVDNAFALSYPPTPSSSSDAQQPASRVSDPNRTAALEKVMRGLFDATRAEELREEAEQFLFGIMRHIFHFEVRREMPLPPNMTQRNLTPLTTAALEGIVQTVARAEGADSKTFIELELQIVKNLREACDGVAPSSEVNGSTAPQASSSRRAPAGATRADLWSTILHSLASKHCTHCYDAHWARKTGGWAGIDMLVRRGGVGRVWTREHQLEIIRGLLYMLKDMPADPPGNIDAVAETLIFVLVEANTASPAIEAVADEKKEDAMDVDEQEEPATTDKAKKGKDKSSKGKGAEDETSAAAAKDGEETDEKAKKTEADKAEKDSAAEKAPTPRQPAVQDEKAVQERQFNFLVGILVAELSSSNSHVRKVTRRAFELLASLRGVSVTDVLLPVKDRLLIPIFQKPLRALPFGMQIGHIDAITYCLELRPPVPQFNEELFRVLTEALALADAEDAALIGRTSQSQYKNMLAVTSLRVVAIRLLASAMACPEFAENKQTSMRMRIITVYFKSLYSRAEEVVKVAYAALRETLLLQTKLPKDVLQNGLRPILMTLADPTRLTAAGLEGLARLLELLTSYFKVEIGSKLLTHMQFIANPDMLEKASAGALEGPTYAEAHHLLQPRQPRESDPIETLAAVTRVFHLLPPAAVMFMDQLCSIVCSIEAQLHRAGPTPFTEPLAQFLNKFPEQAVQHMFSKLDDARYVRCFRLALGAPVSVQLREELKKTRAQYLLPLFGEDADEGKALAGLHIVKDMIKLNAEWVTDTQDVFAALIAYWDTPACMARRRSDTGPTSRERRESLQMVDIYMAYLDSDHNLDAYFQLVDIFAQKSPFDINPVARYLYERVALQGTIQLKRQVIERFLTVFRDNASSGTYRLQVLRIFINPILCATFAAKHKSGAETPVAGSKKSSEPETPTEAVVKTRKGKGKAASKVNDADGDVDMKKADDEELFDGQLMNLIVTRVWKPFQTRAGAQLSSDDAIRIELLHMSTTILEHCSQHLAAAGTARKDTIKFGWANLTAEDVTVKNAAYVFLARFLEVFESPLKIIGQVYFGLLRSHHSEGRVLVRKALDILVPALPKRVGPSENGQPPHWAKWTKRQFADEGHSSAQLFAILHVIARHATLFYPWRDMFVPYIASSLTKLGLMPTSSTETRHLTIELVEVLLGWEKRRLKQTELAASSSNTDGRKRSAAEETEEPRSTRKRARTDKAGTSVGTTSASTTEHLFVIPQNIREMVIGFLVRFISLSAELVARGGVVGKAHGLLLQLTSIWPEVQVRLELLRRPLINTELTENNANAGVLCNGLVMLQVVIKDKDDEWIVTHAGQLRRLVERSVALDIPAVLDQAKPVFERIFRALPDAPLMDEDAEGDEDVDNVDAGATTAAGTVAPAPEQPQDDASAFLALAERTITDSLASQTKMYGAFMLLDAWAQTKPEKIDQHLPALTKALTKLTKEHLAATTPVVATDPGLKLLMSVLDLLKLRISNLQDQRRWFLSALVQLVERSSSIELCRFLLATMSKWILERKEAFPTVKEKAGILVKMMSYESRDNESLLHDYLDLIHSIYTTPAFARTELTVRLENAFLLGCRQRDPVIRQRFMDIFDQTLVASLPGRLQYLLGSQSWEYLADYYWIQQALDLLMGSIEGERPLLGPGTATVSARQHSAFTSTLRGMSVGGLVSSVRGLLYTDQESTHKLWVSFFKAAWRAIPRASQEDVTRSLISVLTREYNLRQVARRPNIAQTLLEGALACTPQLELPPHVIKYLGKSFNAWYTSVELLLNLLHTLPREEDAIRDASQDALAELFADLSEDDMFYGLWRRRCVYAETNTAISYEQNGMWAQAQIMYEGAQTKARTGVLNFTEAEYSLWEDHWVLCAQNLQQWDILTDLAKLEGDTDLLLECAWRLSDWTNEREVLEQALDSLSATSTPRRRVFEAYMALLNSQLPANQQDASKQGEFGRICDEAIQLTLRKWHSLPTTITQAHVPLLQIFQQFVELQEASTVFASLAATNPTNLDQRSSELKTLMQTWRERLPNKWDDINAWSDLVAWRQHVFGAVNKAYLPLVPHIPQNGAAAPSTNSYAYRGYHETAWIINRFAHVARKHYLNDVCIGSLTKIYTLPNIEIQEAFLKLREQAKCHYQNPKELTAGLEVINNTNLMFFAAPQKAEFFTLKGMFMAKLGLNEEANQAFATAIQMDYTLAKAWTEWGRYNDRIFRDQPQNILAAASAVSCYLQAAGLYKSSKVRKVLIRVLWLLSCDDASGNVASAFENFRGETPSWYWITFIPQLLQSLSHREVKYARRLLMSIAKSFPQSLYFPLRMTKEDFVTLRRNTQLQAQRAAQIRQMQLQQQQAAAKAASAAAAAAPPANGDASQANKDGKTDDAGKTAPGDGAAATPASGTEPSSTSAKGEVAATPASEEAKAADKATPAAQSGQNASSPTATAPVAASTPTNATPQQPGQPPRPAGQQAPGGPSGSSPVLAPGQSPPAGILPRQAWEHVDEILTILKTAFPLLALTIEAIAEAIQTRFKANNDEDIYRLTNALLNDALQQYIQRALIPTDDGSVSQNSLNNVKRFAENMPAGHLKTSFEEDFVRSQPNMREYVERLQRWRDRYELALDKRPSRQHLEHCSHYLVEFQHQKFDEVEVPGQYLKLEDNNQDFVKIARFLPTYELTRSSGMCTRRFTILSNKGSLHSFTVQLPSARHCRREERIFQLLRLLNRVLERRKETRKRGLVFHVPIAVALAPQLRLIDYDASFVSLQDIFEAHCEEVGLGKDDPIMAWVEKMRSTAPSLKGSVAEMTNLRMELMDEISTKMVPETILSRYMLRTMAGPSDLWLMRKQFTLQMASSMFLTYVLFVSARLPSRIHISRSHGQVSLSDLVPSLSPVAPQFKSMDSTPFRLTPNLQHFIGPVGIEGVLTSSLMAVGRCLSEPDRDLEEYLSIFVRDEINGWLAGVQRQQQGANAGAGANGAPPPPLEAPRELVLQNAMEMVKRARVMSCKHEMDKPQPSTTPVSQTVLDLINSASNPAKLALQDPTWAPWL